MSSSAHRVKIFYCQICGYVDEAGELAEQIKTDLGLSVIVEPGTWGQFDVLLDGELVASKNGDQSRVGKFLSLGDFPEPKRTVAELRKRLGA